MGLIKNFLDQKIFNDYLGGNLGLIHNVRAGYVRDYLGRHVRAYLGYGISKGYIEPTYGTS
jgi:hypothetical protein